jgi:predicted DNA-binding protein with PD1-like motif
VYTTVELAVAELPGLRFLRRPDAASGYEELSIGRAPDR